jgi:hypothetical protein
MYFAVEQRKGSYKQAKFSGNQQTQLKNFLENDRIAFLLDNIQFVQCVSDNLLPNQVID